MPAGPHEDANTLIERLAAWANGNDEVHVLMLVGSQARSDHPADAFSDIDLIMTVDDPEVFLGHDEWLSEIGPVIADLIEPTAVGGMSERRILFESGRDADFSIVPVDMMRLLGDFKDLAEVRELFGRGVRILVDKIGIADDITTIAPPEDGGGLLSQNEYRALASRFWYYLIAGARKWRRGELWFAMAWCEGQLTASVIELARWWTQLYAAIDASLARDPVHRGMAGPVGDECPGSDSNGIWLGGNQPQPSSSSRAVSKVGGRLSCSQQVRVNCRRRSDMALAGGSHDMTPSPSSTET